MYLFVILIVPFLLFWRWVLKSEVLFWGTPLFQFWPWHQLVKTSLLAGRWPLWNPWLGNGTPLLANLQSAVFYPPNLLYLLLPVEHGLTFSIILHVELAGLFMYVYTRRLGLMPFAATLSALAYMLSGYLMGRTQFVTMVNVAAWLPLALFLCERLVSQRRWSDVLWLALTLAIQLLAGHAQLWFYTLLLIGAYTLFRGWQVGNDAWRLEPEKNKWAKRRSALMQAGGRLSLAVLLALLLSAVQILPTAEFTAQSPRGTGAERTFALTYSFWPWRLITLLAPNFFGHPAQGNYWGYANYWEDHAYLGILPFLLALSAIWHYFRHAKQIRSNPAEPDNDQPPVGNGQPGLYWQTVPFFTLLIPTSLILAMGWNTPIYLWLFDNIPGFGYFQAPARLLIWYTVAMAVLAGVGAQSFMVMPKSRPGWRRFLVGCLGLGIAGLAGGYVLTGRGYTFMTATLWLSIWLSLAVMALLRHPNTYDPAQPRSHPRWWQGLIIAMTTVDLLLAALPLTLTLPATLFTQPIRSAEFIKTQPGDYRYFVDSQFEQAVKFERYFSFDTFGPLNISYWQQLRENLIPNFGVYTQLASTNNDDPLVVGRWQQLITLLDHSDGDRRVRLLSLMNVGYVVGDAGVKVGPTIYETADGLIQQNRHALPRAYFVAQAYQAQDEAEVAARLTSLDFDPTQEVIIMEAKVNGTTPDAQRRTTSISPSKPARLASTSWSISTREAEPDQIVLEANVPEPGFVVLTDTFYPGWQATVDQQPAPIWPANLAFRAVAVEAGTHDIVFKYRPRSFTIGLWISMITLLAVVVMGIYFLKKEF